MAQVTKNMLISEVLQVHEGMAPLLMKAGMHCLGCPSSQMESIEEACQVHGIDPDSLIEQLNHYLSLCQ